MELLPILSTIILMATVATLILAVAAYVLYKLRERRKRTVSSERAAAPQPHLLTAPAPLALPAARPAVFDYATPAHEAPRYGTPAEPSRRREADYDSEYAPAYAQPEAVPAFRREPVRNDYAPQATPQRAPRPAEASVYVPPPHLQAEVEPSRPARREERQPLFLEYAPERPRPARPEPRSEAPAWL